MGKRKKGQLKRLKTYPEEEIKDEDGVLDAHFPAAQSRHPCALSVDLLSLSSGSWLGSVRFGSVRTAVTQTGARTDDAAVLEPNLICLENAHREQNTTRLMAFSLGIYAKLHETCDINFRINNKRGIKITGGHNTSEIKRSADDDVAYLYAFKDNLKST